MDDGVLVFHGIESWVVDPASIATSRRRGASRPTRSTARLWCGRFWPTSEASRVCAMVRDRRPKRKIGRRIGRERKTLIAERVEYVNRIKGLLFFKGISGYEPVRARRARLDELRTGDGRPLPDYLKAQVVRELDPLELLLAQIKAVEAARDALVTPGQAGNPISPQVAILWA